MNSLGNHLRTITAISCLGIYAWMKYSAGGLSFSWAYLAQVTIIVTLTALVPYLFSRLLEQFAGSYTRLVRIVMPSLLACAGYGLFFTVFIAPYAPDASAWPVVARGLIPGIVISLLLFTPAIVGWIQRQRTLGGSSGSTVRALLPLLGILSLIIGLPPEASSAQDSTAHSNWQSIQMERLATGHQVIQSNFNGHASRLIVDTGAEVLVVNSRDGAALGIDLSNTTKTETGAGIAGPLTLHRHPLGRFALGELALPTRSVTTADLSSVLTALSQIAEGKIVGILGQDVLLDQRAVIEISEDRLFFAQEGNNPHDLPQGLVDEDRHVAIPLQKLNNGLVSVTVRINGRTAHLVLDSGARYSMLDNGHNRDWGFAEPLSNFTIGGAGDGARRAASLHEVDSLEMEGWRSRQGQIAVTNLTGVVESVLERGGMMVDGVLGLDVLRAYDAIIDLHRQRLYLAGPAAGRSAHIVQ